MMLGLSGCSHLITNPPSKPTTTKPTMAWYWAGQGTQPSNKQFKQDKYACAQDYRNYRKTQPAIPVQRDPYTELTFMNLHMDTCLESKGWESRPVVSARALSSSSAPTKNNSPDAVEALQKEPRYEEAKKELEAFQATHPDFDELSDDILVFLRKGDTLREAYDKAVNVREMARSVK